MSNVRLLFLFLSLFGAQAFSSPVQMSLTGANGAVSFGDYVGPYYGTLDGSAVTLYCDDFANDAYFGETWKANLSKITPGADLSTTRYGSVPHAQQLYQEIAWLDTQFALQPVSQYGDIHATIWGLFDPKEAPKASSDYWLDLAQKNFMTVDLADWRVVTNLGPVYATGQVQEFLTQVAPSPGTNTATAPEPAVMILIGGGLLGFGLLQRFLKTGRPKGPPES